MKVTNTGEAEDIYMKYRRDMTFDTPFDKDFIDYLAMKCDISYAQDNAMGRTKFELLFNDYFIIGYINSKKIILNTARNKALANMKVFSDFIENAYNKYKGLLASV